MDNPGKLVLLDSDVTIYFHSDESWNGRGFRAVYEVLFEGTAPYVW